jgi:hypothetical protein
MEQTRTDQVASGNVLDGRQSKAIMLSSVFGTQWLRLEVVWCSNNLADSICTLFSSPRTIPAK